jgi:hypothetical protein
MTAIQTPAADAPAAEWGALAVSIPGWGWMPGMLNRRDGPRYMGSTRWAWDDPYRHHAQGIADDDWPDPDDPATAGCLLALLGPRLTVYDYGSYAEPGENGLRFRVVVYGASKGRPHWPPRDCKTLGRACIAAAAALGRWPGGAS